MLPVEAFRTILSAADRSSGALSAAAQCTRDVPAVAARGAGTLDTAGACRALDAATEHVMRAKKALADAESALAAVRAEVEARATVERARAADEARGVRLYLPPPANQPFGERRAFVARLEPARPASPERAPTPARIVVGREGKPLAVLELGHHAKHGAMVRAAHGSAPSAVLNATAAHWGFFLPSMLVAVGALDADTEPLPLEADAPEVPAH